RILHTAKLKSEDITKQWTEHGKLTDDQYAAFEKLNPDPKNPIITREVIDTFLAGQQALGNDIKRTQQQMRGEAAQMVGGEEQLENMLETAEEYVPEDEIDDIRERLKSPKRFKGAMRDLMEHYNRHVGSEGSQPRVSDGQAPRDGGAGYTTQAEYFK